MWKRNRRTEQCIEFCLSSSVMHTRSPFTSFCFSSEFKFPCCKTVKCSKVHFFQHFAISLCKLLKFNRTGCNVPISAAKDNQ